MFPSSPFPLPCSLFPVPSSLIAQMARDDIVEEATAHEGEEEARLAPSEKEEALNEQDGIPPRPRRGEDRAEGQRQEEEDECQRAEEHPALAENALQVLAADLEAAERIVRCLAGVLLDDEGVCTALLAGLDDGRPVDAPFAERPEAEFAADKAPVLQMDLVHAALHAFGPENGIHAAAHDPAEVGFALEYLGGVEHHLENRLAALAVLDEELVELEVMVVVLEDDAFLLSLLRNGVEFAEELLPVGRGKCTATGSGGT